MAFFFLEISLALNFTLAQTTYVIPFLTDSRNISSGTAARVPEHLTVTDLATGATGCACDVEAIKKV